MYNFMNLSKLSLNNNKQIINSKDNINTNYSSTIDVSKQKSINSKESLNIKSNNRYEKINNSLKDIFDFYSKKRT